MPVRITTWNVNGIRNPFGYQPWRDKRTFDAMFDILEADIVIMQELKIQRKDLKDDMVLVPGWDCYFSLPKHKKGYSGVGVYTRQAVCAPIRAEEGVLGVLCPPNSTVPSRDLPPDQHIGGYLSASQLADVGVDAAGLDAEGRCVVLEFPAFVIFGLYSPANSSGLRDDFRYGFLNAVDMRVRNLIKEGKRVIVTGDLNVSCGELDSANVVENMKKEGISHEEFMSTPNRRIFNQLLEGGEVFGERGEGREDSVMYDICRGYHPNRKGMYTHWEQKINARPGNFGSRIDYVLCSLDLKTWFCDSNIQEGLMGSDHCPVFAIMKDVVRIDGFEVNIHDILNPPSAFVGGKRIKEYSTKTVPALSARLMPEFNQRRSIKDMFGRGTAVKPSATSVNRSRIPSEHLDSTAEALLSGTIQEALPTTRSSVAPTPGAPSSSSVKSPDRKRLSPASPSSRPTKRLKSSIHDTSSTRTEKAQQSLKGFFQSRSPRTVPHGQAVHDTSPSSTNVDITGEVVSGRYDYSPITAMKSDVSVRESHSVKDSSDPPPFADSIGWPTRSQDSMSIDAKNVVDPVASMESWSRLFTKPVAPRCEHDEPCKMMKTKKTGFNCGRDFYMCTRPLGPSGAKEKNTQWRCSTFIWSSDWNSSGEREP